MPAAEKSVFLGGGLLQFLPPKKPQKGDFWRKKLVAYLNLELVADTGGGLINSGLLYARIR